MYNEPRVLPLLAFVGPEGLHLGAHLQQSSWAQLGVGMPGYNQNGK